MEVRFYIQVFLDAITLEGVPTSTTRVSNKVIPTICILSQPHFYPLNDKYLFYLNTLQYVSSLKNCILKLGGLMPYERDLIQFADLLNS
jgi:hypothetical protein